MAPPAWLNTAWMLGGLPETWAFNRATRHVAATQAELLQQILRANQATAFGQAHHFSRLRNPRDFQQQVPLARYEDFAPFVQRIAAGESNVLTAEPVDLLEPTSGSTGGEKLIPATGGLRRQFQRAVAVWISDLLRHRPGLREGRAYWSISPAFGPPRRTASGLAIGFADDAAYLGPLERFALKRLLVVPSEAARLPELVAFRYLTLLCLLRTADLTLVSIWNPTFLPALLTPLEAWSDRLLVDVARGTANPPTPLAADLALPFRARPLPRRAAHLRECLGAAAPLAAKLRQTWPRLALISCWTDAAAGLALAGQRALFPTVEIQGKGLLATEGCVTFPLLSQRAPVLALRSHFFEFEPMDGGNCQLAHELERGSHYRVVLTTAAGLYRYQLRDVVEVAGFWNECPLLRFLGKADRNCDLVGEKLDEAFVREVIERLGQSPNFCLLVPVLGSPSRYRLYWQGEGADAAWLQSAMHAGLERNPHYQYACRLGQLGPLEVVIVPERVSAWAIYEAVCRQRGQKMGDIKPAVLDAWPGWAMEFDRAVNA